MWDGRDVSFVSFNLIYAFKSVNTLWGTCKPSPDVSHTLDRWLDQTCQNVFSYQIIRVLFIPHVGCCHSVGWSVHRFKSDWHISTTTRQMMNPNDFGEFSTIIRIKIQFFRFMNTWKRNDVPSQPQLYFVFSMLALYLPKVIVTIVNIMHATSACYHCSCEHASIVDVSINLQEQLSLKKKE